MRAAIIGIGAIARLHARALADIPGVSLVSACCRTEERGGRLRLRLAARGMPMRGR